MAALQKSLRAHGVATKDLQTSNVSVQPNYTDKAAINGYVVSESLTATLRDIGKAGGRPSRRRSTGTSCGSTA